MAKFMRLDVINTLLQIGVVPLFYHGETERAVELVDACARGGPKVIEFTNRGEMAYPVFVKLVRHFSKADPSVHFPFDFQAPPLFYMVFPGTRAGENHALHRHR
jgi:hypothetical protein